jgi:Flp pilus assembly protein TadD
VVAETQAAAKSHAARRDQRRPPRRAERTVEPVRSPRSAEARRAHPAADLGISLGIVALTAAIYAGVAHHGFVYVDDGDYILANRHVAQGISGSGIRWAFTALHSGNWHPLTWISHMLDVQLFGVTPAGAGGHHLVSVGLHALSALLLFVALRRMTGHRWTSVLVAALFAVHPLRVESVAWASERKDVLSGLFFMLTLLAYAAYAARPGIGRYAWVVLAVAAGLMAKPMLVTIPFVLLLLDGWPLARWRPGAPLGRLVAEKLPLLALCIGSSAVTLVAQKRGDSLSDLSDLSIAWRLVEVPISYATYLGKTLWPSGLAFFYPHPSTFQDGIGARVVPAVLGSLVLLAATAVVVVKARRAPWLPVGWLWFLGMLVPVIGLLQVGTQAWADRYAYLPLVGIYLMIAFAIRDAVSGQRRAVAPIAVCACAAIAALAIAARRQVDVWRDTRTLLEHAARVTRNNWMIHNDLGVEISRAGNLAEGRRHFHEALRIRPRYAEAHSNLGFSWFFEGRLDDAQRACERSLEIAPDHPEGHFVLGCILDRRGDLDRACEHFERAIAIRPEYAEAHFRLALTLRAQRRTDDARRHLEEALRLTPDDVKTQRQLAALVAESSRDDPSGSPQPTPTR